MSLPPTHCGGGAGSSVSGSRPALGPTSLLCRAGPSQGDAAAGASDTGGCREPCSGGGRGQAGLEWVPVLCCKPWGVRLCGCGCAGVGGAVGVQSGMHGRVHGGRAPRSCRKAHFEVELLCFGEGGHGLHGALRWPLCPGASFLPSPRQPVGQTRDTPGFPDLKGSVGPLPFPRTLPTPDWVQIRPTCLRVPVGVPARDPRS